MSDEDRRSLERAVDEGDHTPATVEAMQRARARVGLEPRFWAVFSAQASKDYGEAGWEALTGETVSVTDVRRTPAFGDYAWQDSVFVGEVVKCVRANAKAALHFRPFLVGGWGLPQHIVKLQ